MEHASSCLESRLPDFHYSDIEEKDFINLSKICINHTAFEFDNTFFQLSDSLSMDNPLSPIQYEIYMHYF